VFVVVLIFVIIVSFVLIIIFVFFVSGGSRRQRGLFLLHKKESE
jgi:hypothetical protein